MIKEYAAAIFPYDYEYMSIVKNSDLLNGINIKFLLAPKGFGNIGNNASYLKNDSTSDFVIREVDDLDNEEYQQFDIVWISESIRKLNWEYVEKIIEKFSRQEKKILLPSFP